MRLTLAFIGIIITGISVYHFIIAVGDVDIQLACGTLLAILMGLFLISICVVNPHHNTREDDR